MVYFKYLINIENISLSTANNWFPKESVIDAFLGVKGQRCPFQELAFFYPGGNDGENIAIVIKSIQNIERVKTEWELGDPRLF